MVPYEDEHPIQSAASGKLDMAELPIKHKLFGKFVTQSAVMPIFLPYLTQTQLARFAQLNKSSYKWLYPKTGINPVLLYESWGYKLSKAEAEWAMQSVSCMLTCNWWQTTLRRTEHICKEVDITKLKYSETCTDPEAYSNWKMANILTNCPQFVSYNKNMTGFGIGSNTN